VEPNIELNNFSFFLFKEQSIYTKCKLDMIRSIPWAFKPGENELVSQVVRQTIWLPHLSKLTSLPSKIFEFDTFQIL